MMHRAVLFDCFGVICVGVRTYLVSNAPQDKQQELNDLFDQADYGYVTADEFAEQVAWLLTISVSELREIMHTHFKKDKKMVAMISGLHTQYKTGLLTNANDSIIHELFPPEELGAIFDDVIISSEVGMIKPAPGIFELAASRLGVLPEECVFIDDIERNVVAARGVGMTGIVFTDRLSCQNALEQLGIHA